MFTRKKMHVSVLIIFILAALFFAWYSFSGPSNSRYNENPDVSGKIIGSLDSSGTRLPPTSLDEVVERSELIVVGTVMTDAVNTKRSIRSGTPLDQKFEEMFDKTPTYTTADVQVVIKEVLYGKTEKNEITYLQLGSSGNHAKQTKVQKGDILVLFLKEDSQDDGFASVAFEEGVFTILPENKLLAQSAYEFAAKYDGISLDILKEDIAKIVGKKK